jgi:hypothetical protein
MTAPSIGAWILSVSVAASAMAQQAPQPPASPTDTPAPAASPTPQPAPPVPSAPASGAAAPAPAAPAGAPAAPARPFVDILRLKQAGMSDPFLLNKIRTENVRYDLTTNEILQLRDAGVSETVIETMRASGQPKEPGDSIARHAEFPGLARVGKGFLGVFGTSTKSVGKLVVDGETIAWFENEDPTKNFTVYTQNVKEVFTTCVLRPGKNLCLEFGIVTHTGETYRFREPGWKNGDNRSVLDATTYFKAAFPRIFFSERAVSEM